MEYMSTQEVADLYGVTKMTVTRWVEAGRFDPPPGRIGGGKVVTYVFTRDAVMAQYERERAQAP